MKYQIDQGLREYAEPLLETTRTMIKNYIDVFEVFRINLLIAEVLEEDLGIDIVEARHVVGVMVKEILDEFENDEEWVRGLIELEESKGD